MESFIGYHIKSGALTLKIAATLSFISFRLIVASLSCSGNRRGQHTHVILRTSGVKGPSRVYIKQVPCINKWACVQLSKLAVIKVLHGSHKQLRCN
jgi:hypothetical protein